MIYIFTNRNDMERVLAYKTHFGSAAILIKEQKNSTTNEEWKIEQSFLIPLHLLHLFSAKVTVDSAKKVFECNDSEVESEETTSRDDDSVFDLTAPSPSRLPRQYSFDDMMLDKMDWKESVCKHPRFLKPELRKEFNRLENTLIPITENQLGMQEYEESLRSYWCISSSSSTTEDEATFSKETVCYERCQRPKKRKRVVMALDSSSSGEDK